MGEVVLIDKAPSSGGASDDDEAAVEAPATEADGTTGSAPAVQEKQELETPAPTLEHESAKATTVAATGATAKTAVTDATAAATAADTEAGTPPAPAPPKQ